MKVLVIATEPVDSDTVQSVLAGDSSRRGAEVRVIAPALNDSRLAYWVDDPDEAIGKANDTQRETVRALSAEGIDASGDAGDSDPLQAVADALAEFPADRIVLFAHAEGDRAYREDELVAEVEKRFGIPVDRATVKRD